MKYLKNFEYNSDYENYINGGEGEVFLPNVSYVAENNGIHCSRNPIASNYFSGIINAENTTTSYLLFSDGTVGIDNIKTMKINDIEVTPISASTFGTTGNNSYFVDIKKPLTSTRNMFNGCSGLTTLDVSNLDTSKVTDMFAMFANCVNLTSLDLSNWDISNVTNMNNMFYYCRGLAEIRMGGDPSKVNGNNLTSMFNGVYSFGRLYYNSAYDYSKIIRVLPSTWTPKACTLTNGVLIPDEYNID